MRRGTTEALAPWLATAVFFLLWELTCRALAVDEFILPKPSVVVAALLQYRQAIWHNASYTLGTTLLGFLLAIVVGLALGAAVGASRLLYSALYPLLVGFNSVPKAAVVPVLVIWFGIGAVPAVLTAFLISFFPIVAAVSTSLATIEPELRDVLRSLGARPIDLVLKVGLPRAMPHFFSSLKVAVTLAFVGSVISETIAGNRGIGYLMMSASSSFKVPLVFAGLLTVAAMGIGLHALFAAVERRVTGWAFHG